MFLSQILSSDHSCGDALKRFQKYRKDRGLPPVANDTASYCEARERLPEEVVWELARRSGQAIHRQADAHWLFVGRTVKLLDGTTVIMPDTKANQAVYPQSRSQKPGLGSLWPGILLIISLAVGTVLEAAVGPTRANNRVNWDCSVKSVVSSSPVILLWPIDSSAITGSSRTRSVAASTSFSGCTKLARPTSAGDVG